MYQVSFPSVVETFHRALNEVLQPFLSTGNSLLIMQELVSFYHCDLLYSMNYLLESQERTRPFICFVGTRTGKRQTEKCHDPKDTLPFGYEVRQEVFRTVYVGLGRALILNTPPYPSPPKTRRADMQDVEIIWSQLLMVMEHRHREFNERNIFKPVLSSVPAQEPHLDYYLARGEFSCEIRYRLTRM